MAWITRLAILITLITLTPLVPAAGFLPPSRKVKTPDDTKISAWISVLLEDPDETKRINAAIELRNIDPKNHPDAIEALMEALKSDKRPSVRAEAANSLGRIRGGQDLAGPVLEEALANDGSMRVRLQARSALMGLYLSGYRSASGKSIPKAEETQEKAAGLEKLVEEPNRLEASVPSLPDRVTPRTVPAKETSASERLGFRVIPSWMGRKDPVPVESASKTGDAKWWSPRIPVFPSILGKTNKETKDKETTEEPESARTDKKLTEKP
jgi:hypothetical protein